MKILITGRPGIGKTTLIRKIVAALPAGAASGFYTQEIRVSGARRGFAVRTLDGRQGRLAHVDIKGAPRVGKYGVALEEFERVALPSIDARTTQVRIVVVDEIGRMECFSHAFREAVSALMASDTHVLATIAERSTPFIDEVKRWPGITSYRLTEANRDSLADEIISALTRCL